MMSKILELKQLSGELGRQLKLQEMRLVVAESCTGGLLCQMITAVAGSSCWFDRGFVVYSNDAKQELLGVSQHSLTECGAVSQEVVEAMAVGALNHSHADWSIAITGIAGPSGGTLEKPVGTVWFAFAKRDGETKSFHCSFKGNRESIRHQATKFALQKLVELI